MKKVAKVIGYILFSIWLVIALFTTACLLSYNDFKVTTFGKTSLIIIDDDELEPDFKEGDLLVVKRNSDAKINIGDKVFYYNTSKDSDTTIFTDVVQEKEEVNKSETTFVLNGAKVSGDYVIGTFNNAKSYHGFGTILGVLTSKWGFMFLVIFPTLFGTIYEIVRIIEYVKSNKEEKDEN